MKIEVDPEKVAHAIAKSVSNAADCTRRQVGAIIINNNRIVGTGANSLVNGGSCTNGNCPRGKLSYEELPPYAPYDSGPGMCMGLHAEAAALLDAGRDARGGVMFVTDRPCWNCEILIAGAGIKKVYIP